ncbi:hypothetical protein IED13_06445 [Bosea sp. SSUT16]|uniref:Uncharacterized protein n=1 Tax=Bosea spartocytisi TaxID=2773451 RepID=A0A927E5U9_9HYPH|nr:MULTISPECIES: hypothetical protein [Bosea]MBD3845328.1 hypothetical protein [Bosea spartocytisi]MCT4472499.1 hypothetical protein [Bosea spartocytisi]
MDEITPLLARVAGRHGLPPVALAAMVGDWLTDAGKALPNETLLDRKAQDFLALARRLTSPLDDAEIRRLRAEAAAAIAAGRLAEADKALAKAELHLIGKVTDLTALSAGSRVRIGENRADRAALSFLRAAPESYREAAARYGEASALIGLVDIEHSRRAALDQASALVRISEDFGGREGYDAAAAVLRRQIEGLDSLEDTTAFAEAEEALAGALEGLAQVTDEKSLRSEALAHCRRALEHLQRDEAPLLWRALKLRFGRLALILGKRQQDEALLEEAISAFATVLAAWDRSSDETRWLEAEHMIARARAVLGSHRNDLALLERAFNSLTRVAAAVDREKEPLRWAELQDQMGSVLGAMAERYTEPVVIEEAIATFAAALEERRRETVPLLWAQTRAAQAEAMLQLARRGKDKDLAQKALAQLVEAVETARKADPGAAAGLQQRLAAAGELATRLLSE